MPIKTDEAGAVVVQFGFGDIAVFNARHPGNPAANELCFKEGPSGDIGRPVPKEDDGKTTAEIGVQVRLQFNNIASLRVFIEVASELHDKMLEGLARHC